MKNIELLAPAGNMDSFTFAIDAGADAVYIGGEHFSARAFSNNFTIEEIIEAVEYAHLRNVQVYVAVNTLILTNEFDACLAYIDQLYTAGVDAIIVQDYGLLNVAIQRYPDMEIHASTQMSIDSLEGVLHLEKLGVDRVVLAREMSIDEIREIRKHTSIPLEVFVSGALCISYSGQCLMSSLIGGRSGNRGTCSQNCRKQYTLLDENGNKVDKDGDYLLSSKDLLVLDELEELTSLGNVSLKIEGRMKRKEYIKKIVSIFRNKLSGFEVNNQDIDELKLMFNRTFTKGHLFNDFGLNEFRPNHMGVEIGEIVGDFKIKLHKELKQGDGIRVVGKHEFGLNVNMMEVGGLLTNTANSGDVVSIKSKYHPKTGDIVVKTTDVTLIDKLNKESYYQKYPVYFEVSYCGDSLQANLFDDFGTYAFYEENILEKSDKDHNDRMISQLAKSGDYPFDLEVMGYLNEVYAKTSDLNRFRRNAVEAFISEKLKIDRRFRQPVFEKIKVEITEETVITAFTEFESKYKVYSKSSLTNPIQGRVGRVNYNAKSGIVSNYSGLETYDEYTTNFSLNVVNPYSVYYLHKQGAKKVCLSVELNKQQIIELERMYIELFNHQPNLEIICYGRLESMVIKHEYPNNTSLLDSYNEEYKIVRDELSTIYHSKVLSLIDRLDEIPKMNYRLDFTFESPEEVKDILEHYENESKMHNYYGHFDLGI